MVPQIKPPVSARKQGQSCHGHGPGRAQMLWQCGNSESLYCYCTLLRSHSPWVELGRDCLPQTGGPTQSCPHMPTPVSTPGNSAVLVLWVALVYTMAQLLTPAPIHLESQPHLPGQG